MIFDWDGVIIHSEAYHRRSWEMLCEEQGLQMPDGAFSRSFGMRNAQIIPDVFQWAEPNDHVRIAALGDRKERLYRELVRTEGITPLAGVYALLDALDAAGIAFAVGSSTPRENIDAVMEALGITGRFRAIVAAADVSQGKPDPEVFLKAAQGLHLDPCQCVVVEDAHVGIAAARAGGFRVLAVATTHPEEALSAADAVHANLESVDVATLRALI